MCIKENIQKIINEFLSLDSWEERYEHIIFLGRKLPNVYKFLRNKNNIIIGCQSKVWLCAYMKFNKIFFHADSDAIITKGVAALLLRIYSGQFSFEIINNTPIFLYKIGFSSFLTSNRANGIEAMYSTMKKYASYFKY